jgi:hypothetical protein
MTIVICEKCGIQLPLREERFGETSGTFFCLNCGQENRAVFDNSARESILPNVLCTGPQGISELEIKGDRSGQVH